MLQELTRVYTCHVRKRCTGMLLHYADGHAEVLGQWHTSSSARHTYVYGRTFPIFTHVSFEMAECRQYRVITNVSFLAETAEAPYDENHEVYASGEHQIDINFNIVADTTETPSDESRNSKEDSASGQHQTVADFDLMADTAESPSDESDDSDEDFAKAPSIKTKHEVFASGEVRYMSACNTYNH
jgi:hypothetical protein